MEGTKHDQNKVRMDLLPWPAIRVVAKVLTFGAAKYDSWNWTNGMDWSRLARAATDHLASWISCEDIDPESKLSHLAHAACCILFLITYQLFGLGKDDRHDYRKKSTVNDSCRAAGMANAATYATGSALQSQGQEKNPLEIGRQK